ncbi:iron-sulfur cluster scaffold-like protein [Jannaschia pagri]|uniref:Iron-sulfur cluster scaffold-like protein n=1 Tax=Jannaschia pagri TaxID=2829797 RepID=A0ABQ4NNL3_9RHOB|nr:MULTISPECIES: iron-sulfur cluster assembly scaffold protein [unclassified Jannaschia]GIT92139.1 iron-sulfur cluster scaffold-like protein [Jannaschia sp. AI_61]GIT95974.1 iron-sulfur cluster scaffold-like protein [Jannaschia sp. AI_62]
MSEADLIKLYSGRILELAADMPATDPLTDPQVTARKQSPLCGSTVTVSLDVVDGRISRYAQDVKACALGQAAASVSGRVMVGRSLAEVSTARDQLRAMLKDGGDVPQAPFDGFEVLTPARDFRNRHASILLALDATVEALSTVDAQVEHTS